MDFITGSILAGGGVLGSLANLWGADKSADAMRDAAEASADVQWAMYNQTREDQAPYRETGYTGLDMLGYLMGYKPAPTAPVMPNREDYNGDQEYADAMAEYSQRMRDAYSFSATSPENIDWANNFDIQKPNRADYQGEAEYQEAMDQYNTDLEEYNKQMALYERYGGREPPPTFDENTLPEFSYDGQSPTWGGSTPFDYTSNPLPDAPSFNNIGESTVPLWGGYDPARLTEDPGYQFRLQEGTKAIESSAAAKGMLGSGKTLKDLARYSQGLASQEFANARNRAVEDYSLGRSANTEQYGRDVQRTQYGNELGQQAFSNLYNLSNTGFNRYLQGDTINQQRALQDYQLAAAEEDTQRQRALQDYQLAYGRAMDTYQMPWQEQTNLYNMLAGMSGMGQTALQQTNLAGLNAANAASQAAINAGNARANIYTGLANNLSGMVNNLAQIPMQSQLMDWVMSKDQPNTTTTTTPSSGNWFDMMRGYGTSV